MNHWLKDIPSICNCGSDDFGIEEFCICNFNRSKYLRNNGVWISRKFALPQFSRMCYYYKHAVKLLRDLGYKEFYKDKTLVRVGDNE